MRNISKCVKNTADDFMVGLAIFIFLLMGMMWMGNHNFFSNIKTQLDSGDFTLTEKILEDTRGRAFCYQLNWQTDAYFTVIQYHNALAHLYNDAVSRQPEASRRLHEPILKRQRITAADINGLIFVAHINPWLDCANRYKIYHRTY